MTKDLFNKTWPRRGGTRKRYSWLLVMLVVPSSTRIQPYSTYFQAFAALYAHIVSYHSPNSGGSKFTWVDIISLQAHLVGLRSSGGGSWWVRYFHCLGGVTGDQGLRRSCEGLRKTLATKQGCDTETLKHLLHHQILEIKVQSKIASSNLRSAALEHNSFNRPWIHLCATL